MCWFLIVDVFPRASTLSSLLYFVSIHHDLSIGIFQPPLFNWLQLNLFRPE